MYGASKTSLQQSSLLGRLPQMGCTAIAESAVQSLQTAAAFVSKAARLSRPMKDQMERSFTWSCSIEARALSLSRHIWRTQGPTGCLVISPAPPAQGCAGLGTACPNE